MKNLYLLVSATLLFILTSCSSHLTTLSNGKQIDNRLVGVWVGSENDKQIEGVEKKWEMTRNNDGTFVLNFTLNQDGETYNTIENGTWWIENGIFYELHKESGKTDLYTYKVLNQNQVKFVAKNISVEMNSDNYEFIDTRKNSN